MTMCRYQTLQERPVFAVHSPPKHSPRASLRSAWWIVWEGLNRQKTEKSQGTDWTWLTHIVWEVIFTPYKLIVKWASGVAGTAPLASATEAGESSILAAPHAVDLPTSPTTQAGAPRLADFARSENSLV